MATRKKTRKKIKSRKRPHKLIITTPFSRTINTYESLTSAKNAARDLRATFREHGLKHGTIFIQPISPNEWKVGMDE